jgi:hypothetical protein
LPFKDVDPIPRTWVALEKCTLCGLGFFPFWVLDLHLANMFIMIGVLWIILELLISVFNNDARRRCMRHGGDLWA